jgi:hypothetical protein
MGDDPKTALTGSQTPSKVYIPMGYRETRGKKVPIYHMYRPDRSKYTPHQGYQECARRASK